MTYITTENSITFIVDGEMFVCTSDDYRYEKIKSALEEGNEKKAKTIYNSMVVNSAKRLLNGIRRGVEE